MARQRIEEVLRLFPPDVPGARISDQHPWMTSPMHLQIREIMEFQSDGNGIFAQISRVLLDEPELLFMAIRLVIKITGNIERSFDERLQRISSGTLAAHFPGLRRPPKCQHLEAFRERLRTPRSWQICSVILFLFDVGTSSLPLDSHFRKLDVCPGAGKTFAAAWMILVGIHIRRFQKCVCVAGNNTQVADQWKEILHAVLPSDKVHVHLQGIFQNEPLLEGIIRLVRTPGTISFVDEAHHMSGKDGVSPWEKGLNRLKMAAILPVYLLTGTDLKHRGPLATAIPMVVVPFRLASTKGWVLNVDIQKLTFTATIFGASGENGVSPINFEKVMIPEVKKGSSYYHEDMLKNIMVLCMAEVIEQQYVMSCDHGEPGKMIFFLPDERESLTGLLEASGWDFEDLFEEYINKATFLAQHKLLSRGDSRYIPARTLKCPVFWGVHKKTGLADFRRHKPEGSYEIPVCLTKKQAGEGFDDPSVKTIFFIHGANTEMSNAQAASRATRPTAKDLADLNAGLTMRTALIFLMWFDTEREKLLNEYFYWKGTSTATQTNTDGEHVVRETRIKTEIPYTLSLDSFMSRTSSTRHMGQPGSLPIQIPEGSESQDLSMLFGRVREQSEVLDTIEVHFESGNPSIHVSMGMNMYLRDRFPMTKSNCFPVEWEDEVRVWGDRDAEGPPKLKKRKTRHTYRESLQSTLSTHYKKIRQYFRGKRLCCEATITKEDKLVTQIVRETWCHFHSFLRGDGGSSFDMRGTVETCTFCCAPGVPDMEEEGDGDLRPCWCHSLQQASDGDLEGWLTVFLPARICFIKNPDIRCSHSQRGGGCSICRETLRGRVRELVTAA